MFLKFIKYCIIFYLYCTRSRVLYIYSITVCIYIVINILYVCEYTRFLNDLYKNPLKLLPYILLNIILISKASNEIIHLFYK